MSPLQWLGTTPGSPRCAGPPGPRSSCRRCSRSATRSSATRRWRRSRRSARSRCCCWSTSRGPMRDRLQAQAALAAAGGVFVCLGHAGLAHRRGWPPSRWRSSAFGVLFAGVVSSVLAGATTALLLAFILPVSLPAPASAIPDRLAGWGLASAAALLAIALLWPAPARDPLRGAAIAALPRAGGPAARGRVPPRRRRRSRPRPSATRRSRGRDAAVEALHARVLRDAVPADRAEHRRPDGRAAGRRAELAERDRRAAPRRRRRRRRSTARRCAVKAAAAAVLERGADLLDAPSGRRGELARGAAPSCARARGLDGARASAAAAAAHGRRRGRGGRADREFVSALDPGFRAQELSFAVVADRGEHRPDRGRRAAQLARAAARPPAGGPGRAAVRGPGAGRRPRRAALGLAAQQRARRGRARARGARRQPDRRPALVLGRARHAVGAALERAEHRPERRARPARHGRRLRRRRACCVALIGTEHDAALAAAAGRRSCSPASPRRRSRSPPARPRSRSRW